MKKNIIRKKHIILPTSLVMCSAFAMHRDLINSRENSSSCVPLVQSQNTDNIQGIAQASESRTLLDSQASEAASSEQSQESVKKVSHSRLFSRKETSPPQLANGVNTPPATPYRAQQFSAEQTSTTYTSVSGTSSFEQASLHSPIAQDETPETTEVTGEEDIKTRPVEAVEQCKLDHQSASEKNSNLFYIIGNTSHVLLSA